MTTQPIYVPSFQEICDTIAPFAKIGIAHIGFAGEINDFSVIEHKMCYCITDGNAAGSYDPETGRSFELPVTVTEIKMSEGEVESLVKLNEAYFVPAFTEWPEIKYSLDLE